MAVLLLFAFISGLVTILAPCIWPLLPIVLSSAAIGQGHKRPLGITLGIILSFGIFTLTISTLVQLFHLDPNFLRLLAVIVIGFLGLSLIIPALGRWTETGVSRLSGRFAKPGEHSGNDFVSGFITGLSLGIVWSPCAGPILASIATLAATGKVTGAVVLVTTAYLIGVGIPLFFFAYGGQKLFSKARTLNAYTGRIQQVFGIIMLLTALAIFTNYDKTIQAKLLDYFPSYSQALNQFESNPAVTKELNTLKGKSNQQPIVANGSLFNITDMVLAPDFTGATNWLNLPDGKTSLSLRDLKGKVVLVDFWTYTCINCIRTLPFVTSWYDKYKDQGFVVIGVHTPEFEFEKNTDNVKRAIRQFKIHYPVPQDNNYTIWNAYNNEYWPAEYLIDATGKIRRTHFGEGEYAESEKAIQELLKEAGHNVSGSTVNMPDQTPTIQLSPETYIGANRSQYYYPDGQVATGQRTYTLDQNTPLNSFSLGGVWNIGGEDAVTGKDATLLYNFYADKAFLVLRPPAGEKSGTVKVLLDGKVIDASVAGEDVKNGIVTVDTDRLYTLVDLRNHPGAHVLQLQFQTPGIQAFAFTFG